MNSRPPRRGVSPPTPRQGRRRALVMGAAACGLVLAGCSDAADSAQVVSLDLARQELEAGRAILIDIREPDEHATGVAPGARLLPMKQLSRRLGEIPRDVDQPVLLICRTQNRSSATGRALREQGYANVRYVDGGMSEWARRGWPLVKPPAGTIP